MNRIINKLQRFTLKIPAFVVFCICILLTGIASIAVHEKIQVEARLESHSIVQDLQTTINLRLQSYITALVHTRGFLNVIDHMTVDKFSKFINNLALNEHYPGAQGIGFTKRILPEDLDRHIKEQKRIYPEYELWPTSERDEYFSIIYLEPLNWRNRRALGYDMFTDPTRRAAMVRARDTGEPAATGKVYLVQEVARNQQPGFLIYIPIYNADQDHSTVEARRKSLLGFVYSPFRAGDLFNQIAAEFNARHPDVRFSIYDGLRSQPKNLVFDSAQALKNPNLNTLVKNEPFIIAGRDFTISVFSTNSLYSTSSSYAPLYVLIMGLIISIMFFFVVRIGQIHHIRLEKEIQTKECAEAQIQIAKEQAEEANLAKSRFLANMSHEIRTPLGVIIGFADLALDSQKLQADTREYLISIKRNGQELTRIIGEILDLSKIEANRLEVEYVSFSLRILLEEIKTLMSVKAKEKNIDLIFDIDPSLSEHLNTDPTRLRQILINLIGNSLKFTTKGFVKLQVKNSGDTINFIVSDSGIGIPEDQHAHLFQPFMQADNSMTRRFGGTGLGLMLSKQLAQILGGDLHLVESKLGAGTTFCLKLNSNLQIKPSDLTTTQESSKPQNPSITDKLKGARILLVEDALDNQILITRYLVKAGASVETANNGAQAIEKVRLGDFDIILMDIQMPVLDGYEATKQIRKMGFKKSIIALTAHAFQEEKTLALQNGFDDYLTKPINRRSLIDGVTKMTNLDH